MRTTRRRWLAGFLLVAAVVIAGCGGGGVKERSIPVKQVTPIDQAKQYFEGYANGQPVGSEVIGFEKMAEEAKKQDPAKGEIIQRGFQEIGRMMNRPSEVPAKAKEILAKLQ